MHVYDLQIIGDQVFLFVLFYFYFYLIFLIKMLMCFFNSFLKSFSCVPAFLFSCCQSALFLRYASPWACALIFLHDVS